MQFVISEVFESPTWLADVEILRRIEHAGVVERIRGRQVSFLNRMLDPSRMQRLIEAEILDTGAYPLQDYLSDLKHGVFAELAAGDVIDTYRRNLQRAYVERLEFLMTEEPPEPPAFFGNRITRVNVSQSDIRPLARAQLREIVEDADRASRRVQDAVLRAHFEDLAARARTILGDSRD